MVGPEMPLPDDESTPEKRTTKLFGQMDVNQDNTVSYEEFVAAIRADPDLVRLISGSDITTNPPAEHS